MGSLIGAVLLAGQAGPAGAAVPQDFFGVVSQRPLGAPDYAKMDAGDVGTLRLGLSWPQVQGRAGECTPGAGKRCDWSEFDRVVKGAAKIGVAVLPFVYGSPKWISANPDQPPLSGAARTAWKEFLAAAVDRYGTGGRFWAQNPAVPRHEIGAVQIWNEENAPAHWAPKPSPSQYGALLKSSAAAIRPADPNMEIVLGGMHGNPPRALGAAEFLDRIYSVRGIKPSFDTAAIHPYAGQISGVKEQVEELRQVMKSHGDGSSGVRITEIGWASDGPAGQLVKGRQGQAQMLRGAFNLFIQMRVGARIRGVNWFSWRDRAARRESCKWCPYSGLFEVDLDPKPAWTAFKSFTQG